MVARRDIAAGSAFIEMYIKNAKLRRGLLAARQHLQTFATGAKMIGVGMLAMGGAIVAPLALATKQFASMGDSLNKMSLRTGVSVEALSEMGFAAEQSGADLDTLEKGVRSLQRSIADAGRGLATQNDALDQLGLNYANLKDLSPEKQFKVVADRISQVENPTARAATAMMLLGRSGQKLLPLMMAGTAGIEQYQKQARELGLTITSLDAAQAAKFTDTLNVLSKVIKAGMFNTGAALSDMLIGLTNQITENAKMVGEWIRVNQEAIVTVAKWGAGLIAAGLAVTAIGAVVGAFATILGALSSAIGAATVAVHGLSVATMFLARNPLALVGVAVAALAIAFTDWEAIIRKVGSTLGGLLPELGQFLAVSYKTAGQLRAEYSAMTAKAERLAELRSKQSLTNDEMLEAQSLSQDLTSAYPALAGAIDQVGKSAESTAKLLKGMSEALAAATLGSYRRELAEAKQELAGLEQQMEEARAAQANLPGLRAKAASIPNAGELRSKAARLAGKVMPWTAAGRLADLDQQIAAAEEMAAGFDEMKSSAAQTRNQIEGLEKAIASIEDMQRKSVAPEPGGAEDYDVVNANLLQNLARLEASLIPDAMRREAAQLQAVYNERIEKAKEAGQDVKLLEEMLMMELSAIRQKYAETEKEKRLQTAKEVANREKELAWEIAEARIRATKKGKKQERALLDLEEQRRLEGASTAGMNLRGIRELFDLRRRGLEESSPVRTFAQGTFSAAQAAELGGSRGGIQRQMLDELKKSGRREDKLAKINTNMLREVKRIAMEATA